MIKLLFISLIFSQILANPLESNEKKELEEKIRQYLQKNSDKKIENPRSQSLTSGKRQGRDDNNKAIAKSIFRIIRSITSGNDIRYIIKESINVLPTQAQASMIEYVADIVESARETVAKNSKKKQGKFYLQINNNSTLQHPSNFVHVLDEEEEDEDENE